MVRAKLPEPDMLSERVTFRLSSAQRLMLEGKSREADCRSVSEYVRRFVLTGGVGGPKRTAAQTGLIVLWGPEETKAVRELTGAMKRAGNLYNQEVRALNRLAIAVAGGETRLGQKIEERLVAAGNMDVEILRITALVRDSVSEIVARGRKAAAQSRSQKRAV